MIHRGALQGFRILDLTQLIAGPSATSMLAELGADVIKLESPEGDMSRRMGSVRKHGVSATFGVYNKGKRSIALDLQAPEGLEVAKRLVSTCDVMVESFRPGVIERLGLGYEEVCKLRKDIVYVSFSGFGPDGPMSHRPGVDLLIQGESGIMSITGEADGPPLKIGFTAVDAAAGFAISQAILTGLVRRLRAGAGSRIQMSLLDVALYMQGGPLTDYIMSGVEPKRTGNLAPLGSPAEVFHTKDGVLIVSAYFPNQWPDLCRILGLEDLITDPRFIDNARRIENRAELHPLLQSRFEGKVSEEWKAQLAKTRIIFGDVFSYSQVLNHPQVRHNGSVVRVDSTRGTFESIAAPLRLAGAETAQLHVPDIGEHADAILHELGYAPVQIDALRAAGVLV